MVAVLLTVVAWAFITAWYLVWGFLLVPYRLLRRGARKRKVEALRHRELLGTIQGAAAASAAAIVAAQTQQALEAARAVRRSRSCAWTRRSASSPWCG